MRSFAALPVVLLAACASAIASVTVPLTKVTLTGNGSIAKADRARAASLNSRTTTNVPATNWVQFYTASVGIGNPVSNYNLLIDTGSSNTWCGVNSIYNRTSTSIPTGESVYIAYGSGSVYAAGLEYWDQVTLAPNLVITNQSIGGINSSVGINIPNMNGILGLGPANLTNGTLSPDNNAAIPTVMNNLVSQGLIENQVLGVFFAPSTNDSDTSGALTYGGTDPSLYEGELTYAPLTKTYPSSNYWGIDMTVSYGNYTIFAASTSGVVDTGTTEILLAGYAFDTYLNAIPGATYDPNTGLTEIPSSSISSMQPLNFVIAGKTFTLDVAAQLVPPTQNIAWGGDSGKQYAVVANLGDDGPDGLGFILGMTFMERYYTVFDADCNRVGFAQTKNTFTT